MDKDQNQKQEPSKDQKTEQVKKQISGEHQNKPGKKPETIHIKEFLAERQVQGVGLEQAQNSQSNDQRKHRSQCPCGPSCRCGPGCKCDIQGQHDCFQCKGCSSKVGCMEQTSKQKNYDLIDLDLEPQVIHPELKTNIKQQQFRKQIYNQSKQDIKAQKQENMPELERKQQLTPRTAERILKQINEDDREEKKQTQQLKSNWKKKSREGTGEVTKASFNKQKKSQAKMSVGIQKENENAE